ncbi:MAG: LPXTG cell wall anchor domain-containing protein [Lachnospiraceae bacterium]|nr:LPXTG cell wall anchor domain-containing protein [Lachnospiraceae bacterium]
MDGTETTLYPAIDVLGNLVNKQVTAENGSYSFTQLAAGTYYLVFKDDNDDYTVTDGTRVLDFGKLSVTADKSSYSGAYNRAEADYMSQEDAEVDPAAGSGGPASLARAVALNESSGAAAGYTSGITLPAKNEISSSTYTTGNWNAGFYYVEMTLEKQWTNMVTEADTGTEVTFAVTGTIDETAASGTADAAGNGTEDMVVFTESYSLEKTTAGDNGVTSASTNSFPDSQPTVSSTYDSANLTETWTLGTIYLQAEGAGGVIDYSSFTETATVTKEVDDGIGGTKSEKASLTGFITTTSTATTNNGAKYTLKAINQQILYDLAITKVSRTETNGSSPVTLSNAEFTVYSDEDCKDKDKVTAVTTSADGTSGTDGLVTLGSLEPGTYYVKETKAPSGYSLNKAVFEVTIAYEASAPTTPVVTVQQITDTDTGEIITLIENSVVTTNSQTAEAGITPSPDTGSAANADLYTIAFNVEDECIYELPHTGSTGIWWLTFLGTGLMLAGYWLYERRRSMEGNG